MTISHSGFFFWATLYVQLCNKAPQRGGSHYKVA